MLRCAHPSRFGSVQVGGATTMDTDSYGVSLAFMDGDLFIVGGMRYDGGLG